VIAIALAIVASTAVGAAVERRRPAAALAAAQRLVTVLLWLLLPFIAFVTINRLELGGGVGAGLGLAWIVAAAVGTAAWLAGRALRLPAPSAGALVVSVLIANTGNLGIPLCATLIGEEAIGPAVAYDTLVNTMLFLTVAAAVGAATGTRAGASARERVRAAVRNPPLVAALLAVALPHGLVPAALADVVEALVMTLIPMGFFIVGVTLASEAGHGALVFPPPLTAPVAIAIGLRLLVAPALMLALSAAIVEVPDAYVLEAGMATGVNALVVGHAYGLDLRLASGAVAWTTTFVVGWALVAAAV
jgi:hypothetical protein